MRALPLLLMTLVGCEVLKRQPQFSVDPTELDVRGMVLAHIDDDEDDDPTNDGARGFGTSRSAGSVAYLADLGANWVSLSAFAWLDDPCDTTLRAEFDSAGQENETVVAAQIEQAHANGLRVLLSPTLFVADGWRGQLGQCSDGSQWSQAEWTAFESDYAAYVERWAGLAQTHRVELLSVGVEMVSTSRDHPEVLETAIQRVRARYDGLVTYTANWDEVDAVPFWQSVDMVGINAFFPLTDRTGADRAELLAGAQRVFDGVEATARRTGREVLFTEVGFKSHPDAAIRPWAWPEDVSATVDEAYQAMCYEVVLEASREREGFVGMFWWKWFTDLQDAQQTVFPPQEGPHGFTPRGKLAEEVLREAWR